MKVLLVGGAGYVGHIVRPGLEADHEIYCFDRRPVEALGQRSFVGDVNDDTAIMHAVYGMDAIIYMALGAPPTESIKAIKKAEDIDLAFDVNVRGLYRFLAAGLKAGARKFINAGSLSVYHRIGHVVPIDETVQPDAWDPYGISKRLGETLCAAAGQRYPHATIITLRLMLPRMEEDFDGSALIRGGKKRTKRLYQTGPNDVRRVFVAALNCYRPGAHVVQAGGDVEGADYSNARVKELLGWKPQGN